MDEWPQSFGGVLHQPRASGAWLAEALAAEVSAAASHIMWRTTQQGRWNAGYGSYELGEISKSKRNYEDMITRT